MITTIYQVITYMKNPNRKLKHMYTNREDALSYYNRVKENPDCERIEVNRFQDSENSSLLEYVETIVMNHKRDTL